MPTFIFTIYRVFFSSFLSYTRQPKVPPGPLPALLHTPLIRELHQSMTGAKKTMAVIIAFNTHWSVGPALIGKWRKNWLDWIQI
jgi:hypothetical protein